VERKIYVIAKWIMTRNGGIAQMSDFTVFLDDEIR
jgi:hypothetical protein